MIKTTFLEAVFLAVLFSLPVLSVLDVIIGVLQ